MKTQTKGEKKKNLQEINTLIRELSGSLERQSPYGGIESLEPQPKSHLPKRLEVQDIKFKKPSVRKQIHQNESCINEIDNRLSALDQEMMTKVPLY
jgi:hypothetical protein